MLYMYITKTCFRFINGGEKLISESFSKWKHIPDLVCAMGQFQNTTKGTHVGSINSKLGSANSNTLKVGKEGPSC